MALHLYKFTGWSRQKYIPVLGTVTKEKGRLTFEFDSFHMSCNAMIRVIISLITKSTEP